MASLLTNLFERFIPHHRIPNSKLSAADSVRLDIAKLEDRTLYSASPLAELAFATDVDEPMAADGLFETDADEVEFFALSEEAGDMVDASALPASEDTGVPDDAVFVLPGEIEFSGEPDGHIEVAHSEELALKEGTISLVFTADDIWGRHALFSKDFTDNRDGGDLSVFVENGRVVARLQSAEESVWLKTAEGSIAVGEQYRLSLTFGDDGFWLYLNGRMADWDTEFNQGLEHNTQNLVIGANTWSRTVDYPDKTWDHFDGRIEDFTILDSQYDRHDVAVLAGVDLTDKPMAAGWVYGSDADETIQGGRVQGGYGDDTVIGTEGNDRLNGGHGEDRLEGGDGDDLLVSYSDGREPVIAQNYGSEDDPHGEINPITRTYYPAQPIEADDVLIGGAGADTFYFRTLINAKREIILKHVNDDGTINWGMGGVAGENDNVHDHWVDGLGNDVIWDFNRAEGDHIRIEGHTTEVYKVVHQDSDGDGIVDSTVLHLWSNQGSGGGAHNKDLLGTITVFGDLVTKSDYTVEKIDYGIVPTIGQLDEAIAPRVYTSVADDGTPPPLPTPDDGELPAGAVFGVNNELNLSGEHGDHIEIAHDASLELSEGTIALSFTADDIFGRHALFSKDFTDNRDGGDLTAYVENGRVVVRFQSATESVWLKSTEGSITAGEENHLALTFGDDGFWLYLNGRMTDWDLEFKQDLTQNTQNLVIGANAWGRTDEYPDKVWDHFDGQIGQFTIFDSQFDAHEVAALAGYEPDLPLAEPTVIDDVLYGTDKDDALSAIDYDVTSVHAGYGDDMVIGTSENDRLDGGHGEDRLEGGDGDDLLVSYSDGREPVIAQNYGSEDDPHGEIDPITRTYYPAQPIEADDVLIGGAGADTFYFRTLINAKREIILKHVNDDGTINWGMGGVAGENDNVHDHWVDGLGNDVIWDFNRAEGDHIRIEGHTTEVYKVVHQDSDGDGIVDSTVLHLWSNQGSGGGAHNKDLLGTITVFGDLVTKSDYTVEKIDYGIVPTIGQLDEAIAPRVYTSVADDGTPPPLPTPDDGELPAGAVFGVNNELNLSGEHGDHIEIAHDASLELSEGTIALSFTADDIFGRHALFSKDFTDNRDGGDLTAYVENGRVVVRFQSATESVWLKSTEGSISAGEENHLALTFGDDGFWLYLNGRMTDWDLEFKQDLTPNTQNLVIGADASGRTEEYPDRAWNHFDGQIGQFTIFDSQFDAHEVAALAGYEPDLPLAEPTVIDDVLYGTDIDDALSAIDYGVTSVHAGYGDDMVIGTSENDRLDGGHGEDRLEGGDGDDLLVSYSDGREPVIAQNYGSEDDPHGQIDPLTRTYYSSQPIEADDVLVGGAGADTFYFRTLINAKRDIILKHVNDDGTINWGMGGVAGENDNVHDHWVDGLGNDVIWDFNRAEGDQIRIEGHTTEVYKVVHQDSDGDGIVDSTVLHLWSNQGSGGGAHNKDLLGTITVFGDLVTKSDYTVEKIDYGIVPTIGQLDEAIAPRVYTSVADDGTPPPLPTPDDGELPTGAVFGVNNELNLSGEHGDHIEIAHDASLELSEGTIALSFTADDIWGRHALFSKDFTDNRDGGDLTAYVENGRVVVRFQSATESVWLKSTEGSITAGEENHLALTFGDDGFWLYLNGRMTDWDLEFKQDLAQNTQNLVIGANAWGRTDEYPDKVWDHFDGQIGQFTIFDSQFDAHEVAALAGYEPDPPLAEPTVIDDVLYGTDKDDALSASDYGVTSVHAGYGDDMVSGTAENDRLDGGHGEDRLEGGDGDDLLVSYSDGREPVIAQNYGSEDDPDGQIDPLTRTYYSSQPIEADDVLIGGAGADTFYFRTLINAKRDIILKHVNDDGTINWGMGGVAGENDNVHDHWVDGLGNDVIWDFNRAEGDQIRIEGHTTEVYKVVHQDSDGDGILDSTVLHLWSNQGSGGGAHNKDLLGTVTVFGDLVTKSDYTVAKIDYGIVPTIDQLDEAIAPRVYTSVADDGTPPPLPTPDDGDLPTGAVIGVTNELYLSGEHGDHIEIAHDESLELSEGTIALSFTADDIVGRHALFSKDFTGNRDGGDLTAYVENGRVVVRFQSATESVWLKSTEGSIAAGEEYHIALTFGADGVWLYLNGEVTDWESDFTQGLAQNTQNLVIGANAWGRTEEYPDKAWDHFDGQIDDFIIFDSQYDANEVAMLAGVVTEPAPLDGQ